MSLQIKLQEELYFKNNVILCVFVIMFVFWYCYYFELFLYKVTGANFFFLASSLANVRHSPGLDPCVFGSVRKPHLYLLF